MTTPWERFAQVARGGEADRIPVALIVDSPWLPGYAGIDTLAYYLRQDEWLRINLDLFHRFPDVAWVPGFWIEYGMAAEPSAFGARITWDHEQPPSIEPARGGLDGVIEGDAPDPQYHGLMPLVVERYADAERRLLPEGMNIKMVCARGPLAVGGWILGMSDFLLGLMAEPEKSHRFLDMVTTTIIAFLRAQMEVLRAPEGIMVLDDIVGMVSPAVYDEFAAPYLARIFQEFKGLIRIYHNDTPCKHLLDRLPALDFEVFNFSHRMDIAEVQAALPNVALMGNVPPLDVLTRGTPAEIQAWGRDCITRTGGRHLILSAGGGASPGTPAEALDALVAAVR
jgi:uroporphyrinogen-III decarboxylase